MVPSHRPRHERAILDLQAQVNKKLRKKSPIANRFYLFVYFFGKQICINY